MSQGPSGRWSTPRGRAREERGFVIVAVLLLLVALGALAVGMSLETGLATLGARSATEAAVARSKAHAGSLLALSEFRSAASVPSEVGPWAQLGGQVTGEVMPEAGSDPAAHRLVVTARVGRSVATTHVVFALTPSFEVLQWRE